MIAEQQQSRDKNRLPNNNSNVKKKDWRTKKQIITKDIDEQTQKSKNEKMVDEQKQSSDKKEIAEQQYMTENKKDWWKKQKRETKHIGEHNHTREQPNYEQIHKRENKRLTNKNSKVTTNILTSKNSEV